MLGVLDVWLFIGSRWHECVSVEWAHSRDSIVVFERRFFLVAAPVAQLARAVVL